MKILGDYITKFGRKSRLYTVTSIPKGSGRIHVTICGIRRSLSGRLSELWWGLVMRLQLRGLLVLHVLLILRRIDLLLLCTELRMRMGLVEGRM